MVNDREIDTIEVKHSHFGIYFKVCCGYLKQSLHTMESGCQWAIEWMDGVGRVSIQIFSVTSSPNLVITCTKFYTMG